MSIIANFNVKANTKSVNNNTNFTPAKVWINVGFVHPTLKDKNNNPVIITLPLGIPLDTCKDASCNMSAPETVQRATECSNALKKKLLEHAASLEPGERIELPADCGLQLFIQRARDNDTDIEEVSHNAEEDVDAVIKL